MSLFRIVAVCTVALFCAVAVNGEDATWLRSGVWDVSTLVPGRGSIPPNHELRIDPVQWALRERNFSRFSRVLEAAAAQLGVIYAAVPRAEAELCHAASSLRWQWTAVRAGQGFSIDCLLVDWFTPAALRKFAREGYLHLRLDSPQPLLVGMNGTCVSTSWSLQDVEFARVSEDNVVVAGTLIDDSKGSSVPCKAYFELSRRPTVGTKEKSSSSNIYSAIAMLLVVMALRFLPRYILTRTGQIESSSYRGRNPAKLSAARRAELFQKQRRIIELMKAEDQANAQHEKTS
ncbi:hypothetical protein ABL78_6448 [Leptomonas seymouri]|uniref:Transmembrane protein n=1 Tax=Leptomonas seymouri TaxID=5684 RepID=A0A0N1I3B3_LEPSE|nr:hypothetical protein ABL78_6448 [Leptomonas seymouri]|eukprot:KPI84485.1 hypothetical protein ABL78_6448 [Leptomonas seymouri]